MTRVPSCSRPASAARSREQAMSSSPASISWAMGCLPSRRPGCSPPSRRISTSSSSESTSATVRAAAASRDVRCLLAGGSPAGAASCATSTDGGIGGPRSLSSVQPPDPRGAGTGCFPTLLAAAFEPAREATAADGGEWSATAEGSAARSTGMAAVPAASSGASVARQVLRTVLSA
jgi:hypothetical protein